MAAFRAASGNQLGVFDTQRAQKLGAGALEKPQIGGVIDASGEVGVLIIDAQSEPVRCGRLSASAWGCADARRGTRFHFSFAGPRSRPNRRPRASPKRCKAADTTWGQQQIPTL